EALERELEAKGLPTRALKALEAFHAIVQELQADREQLRISQFFKSILERTGLAAALRQEGTPEAQGRLENLEELVNAAADADERGQTLEEFLDRAVLVSDSDGYDERARPALERELGLLEASNRMGLRRKLRRKRGAVLEAARLHEVEGETRLRPGLRSSARRLRLEAGDAGSTSQIRTRDGARLRGR